MRDFFDRTKAFWAGEIMRRRVQLAEEGAEVEHLTEKVGRAGASGEGLRSSLALECCPQSPVVTAWLGRARYRPVRPTRVVREMNLPKLQASDSAC